MPGAEAEHGTAQASLVPKFTGVTQGGPAHAVGLHHSRGTQAWGTRTFVMGGKQTCLNLTPGEVAFIISDSEHFFPLPGGGHDLSPPRLFIIKAPWKDILEQRAVSASTCKTCRNLRDGRTAAL